LKYCTDWDMAWWSMREDILLTMWYFPQLENKQAMDKWKLIEDFQ